MGIGVRLPGLLELALVLIGGWWCGATLAGWWFESPNPRHADFAETRDLALPPLASLAGLFGKAPSTTPAAASKPKPVAPLNIRLLGTVLAGKDSVAIVALSTSDRQRLVMLGETIVPHVRLVDVQREAIVVERAGVRETIAMPKSRAAAMPQSTFRAGRANVSISRRFLDKQLQQLPALLSQARAVPHYLDGRFDGFALLDIKPASVFERMGFKNGDVLLSVNGKMARTPQDAMRLYQALRNASAYDIEIRRGATRMHLHVDVR